MFKEKLNKYNNLGSFTFEIGESLGIKCNSPNDKGGVYLIYKIQDEKEVLIYIGSSGLKAKDGSLKVRKGGIKDRLVNGYHPNRFGEEKRIPRRRAFPLQMVRGGINKIKIYWWVTYCEENTDFPTDVETSLRNQYLSQFFKLPDWHN